MISPVEAPAPVSRFASPATRRLLTRYVARRVPACDVDDVVQATLCDALASGRAPSAAEDFQRWLLSIARFKVVDAHRAAARATPGLDEALPAAPSPVEAVHLLRWVEHQIARDQDHQITLRWMAREAEGDKLESIAADESVPAPRVRQRVSRLRRWMRERWVAELTALAALALAAVAVAGTLGKKHELALPEISAARAARDPRLVGAWRLVSFTPATPLPEVRRAIVDRVSPSLVISFDGQVFSASAAEGTFTRRYAASIAGAGRIEATEIDRALPASATYTWSGDDLVITVPAGAWAGKARLRR